jgi:transposase
MGRASVAPERLLRASLLQGLYSVRSERQLMERIDYNLLLRWFAGLGIDDPVWDHSTLQEPGPAARCGCDLRSSWRPCCVTPK